MEFPTIKRLLPTEGERGVGIAYLGVALAGALMSFTVISRLGGNIEIIRTLSAYDIWSVIAGTIGSSCGLFVSRNWFGHPGVKGIWWAFVGLFATTFFGALIGGTLVLPLYGTMFGPFALALTLYANPLLSMFWASILTAAHLQFLAFRKERNSIFADPEDDGIPLEA